MREAFFKVLPFVLGALLGYLLFMPPDLFQALGPWRPLVFAALALVGLLAFTGIQIALTLPSELRIEPLTDADGETPPDVVHLLAQFHGLGFEPRDAPVKVYLRPAGFVWTLTHPAQRAWATVFATGTIPRRLGYDVISAIDGDRGYLTSVADPGAAVLPLAPGSFKQVLPGAPPAALLDFHRQAQDYLTGRGVRFATPAGGDAPDRIRAAIAQQRKIALANPVKVAAQVLWRVVTKRSPFFGPVARQARTEATLRELLTGRGIDPGRGGAR
jgi:hypothetical protein